jgi:hypothetical protein
MKTLRQNVSRKDMRACVTHAALVAEDPAIQQLLPQWVLGNMSVMLKRDVAKVQPLVSPNIQFIRGKCGWMNATMMVKLLRAIKLALTPVDYEKQIILLLDCARQHLHAKITAAAKACDIWLLYVPAKLTWLVQPCDTHVFMKYNAVYRLNTTTNEHAIQTEMCLIRHGCSLLRKP